MLLISLSEKKKKIIPQMQFLYPLTKLFFMQVLRDGQWQEQDAAILVPGDIISIKLGDIIPADARLLEGDPLKIDQASASYK